MASMENIVCIFLLKLSIFVILLNHNQLQSLLMGLETFILLIVYEAFILLFAIL